MPDDTRREAPFTEDEVRNLNAYQQDSRFHEYTGEDGKPLIATRDGWVAHPGGPVVQNWAHAWACDGTWYFPHVRWTPTPP